MDVRKVGPWTALAALAALAACATAPTTRSLGDLSPDDRGRLLWVQADEGRDADCNVSLEPPPALSELVDSAAVFAELDRRWQAAGRARGRAVLSASLNGEGETRWLEVLESDLPDALGSALADVFDGRLTRLTEQGDDGPRQVGWVYRLEVAFGEAPGVRVGPAVFCPPRLRNSNVIAQQLQQELIDYPFLRNFINGRRTTVLQLRVDADGTPASIKVARSSGYDPLDRVALKVAEHTYFDPALHDGRPVSWGVMIPINFIDPESARSSRGRR